MARRSYGTGALYVRRDARGRATWYGKWRVGVRQVKRRIGAVRQTGTREGLTRAQAERELRRKIESTVPVVSGRRAPERSRRPAKQLVAHLSTLGRKPSTLNTYRSLLRAHLSPGLRRADSRSSRADPRRAPGRLNEARRGRRQVDIKRADAPLPGFRVRTTEGMARSQPGRASRAARGREATGRRHPLPHRRGAGGRHPGRARRTTSARPTAPSTDGGDDRPAPGRAARAALARRRLARRRVSACAGTTCAASSARRRPDARSARCPWPTGSRPSSTRHHQRAASRATTTSSSPTAARQPARPLRAARRFGALQARPGVGDQCASTTCATRSARDGRGRRADAHAPGVDGPPRLSRPH